MISVRGGSVIEQKLAGWGRIAPSVAQAVSTVDIEELARADRAVPGVPVGGHHAGGWEAGPRGVIARGSVAATETRPRTAVARSSV